VTPAALVARLRDRGLTLRVADGSLRVAPASSLSPADREAIRANLPGLILYFAPSAEVQSSRLPIPERNVGSPTAAPWDAAEALKLMRQADEVAIRLGVPSTHPALQAAAARAIGANDRGDLAGLRAAVTEVENLSRRLAGR
jgi:hypothetical protein